MNDQINGKTMTLDGLRWSGMKLIVLYSWLMSGGLLAYTLFAQVPDGIAITAIAILCGVVPTLLWMRKDAGAFARITVGITVPIYPAAALALMKGDAWQVDIHMAFFASVAIVVILCDWRAILASTLVVAVHHLGLNYVATEYVFSGGASFDRVVLHAVILLMESGVLMWVASQLTSLFTSVASEAQRAREALAVSETAQAEAKRLQDAQANVVEHLSYGLAELAECRLTHRIAAPFDADYDKLRCDYNRAMDEIEQVNTEISTTTHHILESISELREATAHVAQQTEKQAASLTETSATMNDITSIARSSSQQATSASAAVAMVNEKANLGTDVVMRTIDAMTAIESSSGEIGQIISIIDGIAFQTNLLALNAGVEAARAGDAGKGFAVVAVEVRTLAQRCAEAATSVNKLISASKDQVGRGSSLVNETGTVLTSIAEQIVGLRAAIDEMASSAATQSTRFGQINETVVEMTRITEQSAAMIEESFATTQSLAQESELARRALAKFNTHSDTNHNAPARAAA